jgi:hypothetical protein
LRPQWWAPDGQHQEFEITHTPWYPHVIPAVKFAVHHQRHVVVLLDAVAIDVPGWFVYMFPVFLFLTLTVVWFTACRGMSRTGFSCRAVCEAATCFMCLWADLATKHNVVSKTYAWAYVVVMMVAICSWNALSIAFDQSPAVAYVFASIVGLLWLGFSWQRAVSRKVFRQRMDPLADNAFVADCTVRSFTQRTAPSTSCLECSPGAATHLFKQPR